ncbi:MAG: hypothetical protein AMXMBFR64_29300 [Myxococcales bacterium]
MIALDAPSDFPSRLPRSALDSDATAAIAHLQRNGFMAYFVGGCVRDLLLGRRPKDFDIVTSATPTEIKRLFRNCRLIGRRFRLAHLYYGSKIIEAATFRGASAADGRTRIEDQGSVERTNTFGTPEEDAFSRDFTVNALLYDPVKRSVIDFVGGTRDLVAGCLRTIGDPMRRFEEDPVRILRAVKFASRLGFRVAPEVQVAMRVHAHLIATCPPPRVTEEVFRIAESRHFELAVEVMTGAGVLGSILPEVATRLDDSASRARFGRLARAVDRTGRAYESVPRELILPALLYPLLIDGTSGALRPAPGLGEQALTIAHPLLDRMQIPARLRESLRATMNVLGAIRGAVAPPQGRRARSVLASPSFDTALGMLRLIHQTEGGAWPSYSNWAWAREGRATIAPAVRATNEEPPSGGPQTQRQKRRRRRSTSRATLPT